MTRLDKRAEDLVEGKFFSGAIYVLKKIRDNQKSFAVWTIIKICCFENKQHLLVMSNKREKMKEKIALDFWRYIYVLFVVGEHSNNKWHFFWLFSDPLCDIVQYLMTKLLWNKKWNKVSFESLSCFVTKSFTSKSIKNSVSKSKKSCCDTSSNPLPLPRCHILFEWPLIHKKVVLFTSLNLFIKHYFKIKDYDKQRKGYRIKTRRRFFQLINKHLF